MEDDGESGNDRDTSSKCTKTEHELEVYQNNNEIIQKVNGDDKNGDTT
eukprot:CAMPEP_0201586142 /NCGR_PEP_ID=MMETSP0190_2-20130828/129586_1 /ASSEMBLY_ACC=CAM_ASM_000263 /TAXON_ID=37353 /ORGANISM="Rosalina sp." /LENGTH=47 /DNA_ID= /DNA_START= /DNA_END= /DNA_ORIENTATION=